MEAKNHPAFNNALLNQLTALCKTRTQDNWLTMGWEDRNLSDKNITEILQAILKNIDPHSNITIDLGGNLIGDYGIQQIFQTLAQYHFSKSLGICLFDNLWGTDGLTSILNYLTTESCPNEHLYLDLGKNKLTDEHAMIIVNALQNSKLPKKLTLILSENKITDQGANALLATLSKVGVNTHIIIDLTKNRTTNRKNIKIKFESSASSDEESSFMEEKQSSSFYFPLLTTLEPPTTSEPAPVAPQPIPAPHLKLRKPSS